MSHELFHDVTDRRPRAGRATGGTLFVSILAHALIIAAVVVVPLLATDVLPLVPDDGLGAYAVPVVPPPPVAVVPATTRTPSPAATSKPNVAPTEASDHIADEAPPPNAIVCNECVVTPAPFNGVPDSIGDRVDTVVEVPPPPPPARPLRATALNMPRKIRDVAPEYPAMALAARVEGVVIIEAVIAVDGSVRDARVLRSQPLLDRAAVDAVRQWRYEPTRLNGVPVPVIVTVTVQFRLQR
jgi:protein TonB